MQLGCCNMSNDNDHIELSMKEVAFESRLMIRLFLDQLKNSYQLELSRIGQSEETLTESEAF